MKRIPRTSAKHKAGCGGAPCIPALLKRDWRWSQKNGGGAIRLGVEPENSQPLVSGSLGVQSHRRETLKLEDEDGHPSAPLNSTF